MPAREALVVEAGEVGELLIERLRRGAVARAGVQRDEIIVQRELLGIGERIGLETRLLPVRAAA